jgi:AcrR family transcriptional regulator
MAPHRHQKAHPRRRPGRLQRTRMGRSHLARDRRRLDITRPALYYHYRSKEDILTSIHHDIAHSMDDILEWARRRPAGPATRTEILNRLATLMAGPWGAFIGFAQANEAAMRNLTTAEEFRDA